MRTRHQREWYVPKGAVEVKDANSTAVSYIASYGENGSAKFQVVGFGGKRQKPDFNYLYRSEEQAREKIKAHADGVRAHEEMAAKRQKERYDVRAADWFKVGDCLHTSWGYDQTNVEFYKVTKVYDKSIEVVAIGGKTVPGSQGFMSERVVPDPDNVIDPNDPCSYAAKHNGIKRVTRGWDGQGYVRIHQHSGGYKISPDGAGTYSSWYA